MLAADPPTGSIASPAADEEAVPDGTPEELLKFIEEKQSVFVEDRSDRLAVFRTLMRNQHAIVKAADKIFAQQPDDATTLLALERKLAALSMLRRFRDDQGLKDLEATIKQFAGDKRPAIARLIALTDLSFRIDKAGDVLEPEARQKQARQLLDEFLKLGSENASPGTDELQMAMTLGNLLSMADDPSEAVAAYKEFAELFRKSSDERIREYADKMVGTARLLGLPGNEMKIEGTLLDGQKFDWASYRGKVVLVDFWATWCGPCIAELPNVRAQYAKYHDRGFDVVGISLDEDIKDLREFVEREQLPWPTLASHDTNNAGWNHPMAVYYGILGIPRAILVGTDGKVISTRARGEELGRLLDKQFAPK